MGPASADRDEIVNYWPALLDAVTSSLMMFLLVTFLQNSLSVESLQAAITRGRQDRFLTLFHSELASELQRGDMAVARNLDYLQITFSDHVLFASADHHLQPGGRVLLRRCAEVLIKAGTSGYQQIQVEGHTDDQPLDRPSYPTNNWELSTARAISMVQFLAEDHRLRQELFSANGYASFRPVASNETLSGRARNRRIEIRIFFAGGALDHKPRRES